MMTLHYALRLSIKTCWHRTRALSIDSWDVLHQDIIRIYIFTLISVSVPDTKGTYFEFSTPFCSSVNPAKMHVIPQSTEALNVTLEVLLDQNQSTSSLFAIKANDSLHYQLQCKQFVWDSPSTRGNYL